MYEPVTLTDLGYFMRNVLESFSPMLLISFTLMLTTSLLVAIKKIFIK